MDIVDLARMFLQIIVEEVLQDADGQLALVFVEDDRAGFFADVPLDREAFFAAAGFFQRSEQLLRLGLEDDAVDGLEDLRRVVDVFKLDEGIARRMVREVFTGMVLFQLFIAALGRGERVVAVADGEHHRRALQAGIFFADRRRIFCERIIERLGVLAVNQTAGDMAAVLHKVKVVEFFQTVLLRGDRLDENFIMVVAEHQDVRQLDGGVAADALARRDTLGYGALGGADGGRRTGGIVVGVKVDHADQPFTDRTVLQRAFNVDIAVRVRRENVIFHIIGHCLIDDGGMLRLHLGAKLGLRQDQIDRGHCALGVFAHTIPVRLIGRKLVAGDDGPFFHMVSLREQDVSR